MTVILVLLVGLTAILSAAYLKLQTEWDAAVAVETRDFGKQISKAVFDAKQCLAAVDRMMPIELAKALTPEGAPIVMTLADGAIKLGDEQKPLLAGYIEIVSVKFANAILAGKTTAGPDAYVGDLVMDIRRRYVKDAEVETKRLGRIMFLSEKNIFNTYTVKGCRGHSNDGHKAQLCTMLGGTPDPTGKYCMASCPAQTVTLSSGLKYEVPKSPNGSLKHLMSEGEVQVSALCTNGAWVMFNEKMKDPSELPRMRDVTVSRLSASRD